MAKVSFTDHGLPTVIMDMPATLLKLPTFSLLTIEACQHSTIVCCVILAKRPLQQMVMLLFAVNWLLPTSFLEASDPFRTCAVTKYSGDFSIKWQIWRTTEKPQNYTTCMHFSTVLIFCRIMIVIGGYISYKYTT